LFVVNPSLYDRVPYDPYKDFDPVVLAADVTSVITVHPSLPAKTVKDLVGFIKANPGKHNYTSGAAERQESAGSSENSISTMKNFVCKYLC